MVVRNVDSVALTIPAMPAGRTHDQITLICLLPTAVLSLGLSRSPLFALICSGAFLFSGLMFGPDLDVPSCQYRRWGWLRWLWLPYQKSIPHRSVWSHGLVVGTVLRLGYLGCWLLAFSVLGLSLLRHWGYWQQDWQASLLRLWYWGQTHPLEVWAALVGLELGAMSHSCSDWLGSAIKRLFGPVRRSGRNS